MHAGTLLLRPGHGNSGEPAEHADGIAAAVAFLAGPDGAWINGQTLRANGGII